MNSIKFAIGMFFLPILGLFIGVILIFDYILKPKSRSPYLLVIAGLGFSISALIFLGEFLNLPKLTVAGCGIPISLICVITAIEAMKRHNRCTEVVSAKYIEAEIIGNHRSSTYAPIFSYYYERKLYKGRSLATYSEKKLKNFFELGKTYEIHIDPKNPEQCVDKRVSPKPSVALLVFSIIMLAVSILMTITAQ